MQFRVMDSVAYEEFAALRPKTVYSYSDTMWRCTTNKGNFLYINCKGGFLMMSHEEREYDAACRFAMVGAYDVTPAPIRPEDIITFMNWKIDAKNIWSD